MPRKVPDVICYPRFHNDSPRVRHADRHKRNRRRRAGKRLSPVPLRDPRRFETRFNFVPEPPTPLTRPAIPLVFLVTLARISKRY